jgi:hypothetical protein
VGRNGIHTVLSPFKLIPNSGKILFNSFNTFSSLDKFPHVRAKSSANAKKYTVFRSTSSRFVGRTDTFSFIKTSAYTTEKIEGKLIPPYFTHLLIENDSERNLFIRSRQELSENSASMARTVFDGAPLLFKIEIALDLNTEGKAFFKSTKH